MQQTDLFGNPVVSNPKAGPLARAFILAPFSVLSARDGWWQDRKAQWIALGIKSELGRGGGENAAGHDHAAPGGSARPAADYSTRARSAGDGWPIAATAISRRLAPGGGGGGAWLGGPRTASSDKFSAPRSINTQACVQEKIADGDLSGGMAGEQSGTSIFDPVLCELAYRWFCPPGGVVLDPFAGGSVRGIVAGALGLPYHGVDLRIEQVQANREQAEKIELDAAPQWHVGDAAHARQFLPSLEADFIFSCPPYGDLERYSDDPADLSTMEYPAFIAALGSIVAVAAGFLKRDRFACFVVGDFRDPSGLYRGFPADICRAF